MKTKTEMPWETTNVGAVEHVFLRVHEAVGTEASEEWARLEVFESVHDELFGVSDVVLSSSATSNHDAASPSLNSSSQETYSDPLTQDKPHHSIRYSPDGIGQEYTDMPRIVAGAFPHFFPCGCPYSGIPRDKEIRHMLNQATNASTSEPMFIFTCST